MLRDRGGWQGDNDEEDDGDVGGADTEGCLPFGPFCII